MLVKLEQNRIRLVPKTYAYDGITYSDYDLWDEETHRAHGWKDLVVAPMPEDAEESYGWRQVYREDEDAVYAEWELYELPLPPEPAPDYMAFLAGLMEGYGDE